MYNSFASFFVSSHGQTTSETYLYNFKIFQSSMRNLTRQLMLFPYYGVDCKEFAELFEPHRQQLVFNSVQGNNTSTYCYLNLNPAEYSIYAQKLTYVYSVSKKFKEQINQQNQILSSDVETLINKYKLMERIELISNIREMCIMYRFNYETYVQEVLFYLLGNFKEMPLIVRKAILVIESDRHLIKDVAYQLDDISTEIEQRLQSINYVNEMDTPEFETFYQQALDLVFNIYEEKREIPYETEYNGQTIELTQDLLFMLSLFATLNVILEQFQKQPPNDANMINKIKSFRDKIEKNIINPWIQKKQHFIYTLKNETRPWKQEYHDPNTTYDTILQLKGNESNVDIQFGINTLLATKINNAPLSRRQQREQTTRRKKSKKNKTRKISGKYAYSDNVVFTETLNDQQRIRDSTLDRSGTSVLDDKRFRYIGFKKNFDFFLRMFLDQHCFALERNVRLELKHNIQKHYRNLKYNKNAELPANFFSDELKDEMIIKSRVMDFIFILRLILSADKVYLSLLIYFFQYLIGIEFVCYLIPSCRSFIEPSTDKQTIERRGGRSKMNRLYKTKRNKTNVYR